MKPYETHKLTDYPDVGDIRAEGRKSSVGRIVIVKGKAARPWKQRNELIYRGYSKPNSKKAMRRNMKRADKAKAMKRAMLDELA